MKRVATRRTASSAGWVAAIVLAAALPPSAHFAAGAGDGESSAAAVNIVLIVSDDQGWNDIGYHNPELRTPNLDRLAGSGVRLDRHYVQPQCTPTRVALLTGRYPSRFGPHCTVASNDEAFPAGAPTLASVLKSAGYETALMGKWHLGSRPEWGPNRHGFSHSYGSLAGAVGMYDHRYRLDSPFAVTWHRNHEFIEEEGHATDLVTAEAVRWIGAREPGRPFFLYLPFHSVHTPLVERDPKWEAMNAHIGDRDRRLFAAALSHLDWAVGEIVRAIEERGWRERTLIVFTSDNGGIHTAYAGGNYPPPDPALKAGFSSNAPLRGGKTTAYEGGIRVPAFANWPGVLEPAVFEEPMHAVDWLPTLAAAAGVALGEAGAAIDGIDQWPALSGRGEPTQRSRPLYWVWGAKRQWEALQSDGWKIVRRGAASPWQLFNVLSDPGESRDLAGERPDLVERLDALFAREREDDRMP